MLERFADTSGWVAWADAKEVFHARALVLFTEVWDQGGRLVTTSPVLAELTALFNRLRMPKLRQIQFIDQLQADPSVEIVSADAALESAAWQLWRSRPDKDWTFVDCFSFVVMQRRHLGEALTSDHHFEQAGFIRLLK
jgi:predicted nucleic acid-binding protein